MGYLSCGHLKLLEDMLKYLERQSQEMDCDCGSTDKKHFKDCKWFIMLTDIKQAIKDY